MLRNAAELIELLADRGPLAPAAIAGELGIARSSVYRLASGTSAIGLTEIRDDSRVALTTKILSMADAAWASLTEWEEAQSELALLSEATGQTSYLSVLRRREAVCVAWSPGSGIDLLVLRPGRVLPLYAGAAGRCILAHMPDGLETVLEAGAPLTPFTEHTFITARELESDIERSRKRGYTVSDEDVTLGIGAVGVPLHRPDAPLAVISVAGPIEGILNSLQGIVKALHDTASRLSRTPGQGSLTS